MPVIVISSLEPSDVSVLEERARRHGATLEAEVAEILRTAVRQQPNGNWREIDALRERISKCGQVLDDSIDLLREDRDR